MAKCEYKNCNLDVKCKGLCHKHYNALNYQKHIEKRRLYDKSLPRRYKKFKAFCKQQKIPTDLTYQGWLSVIEPGICEYCEGPLPSNGYGLDRMYPNIGYFKNNVVPCCTICNLSKRDTFTYNEFKVMMKALKEYRGRKNI